MDSTLLWPLSMKALTNSGQGRDCNGLVLGSVPGQPLSLEKEEVNGLASWIGSIKEKDRSTESKELSSTGTWMGTWEWGPNMKTFVAHFNLHQQASVVREALKKQVGRMTQPGNLSQPLPSGVSKVA